MEDNFRILKPYFRGFPIILAAMVIGILVARKYLSYATPMYESMVKLKLADINEGVPGANLFKDLDVFASSNKIQAEIEVLRSKVLIEKALDSLDFQLEVFRKGKVRDTELFDQSPVMITHRLNESGCLDSRWTLNILSDSMFQLTHPKRPNPETYPFGQWIRFSDNDSLRIALNKEFLASKVSPDLVDHYEFEVLSKERLTQKVMGGLDIISVDKDVAVIRISYKSPVPEKAAILVNRLAQTYISDYIENKYQSANVTVRFLEEQINAIAHKLAQSEVDIKNYRDRKNITNIQQETETELRKISQLKIQQTNIKMNLDAIRDLETYLEAGKSNFLELAPNFEAFTDLLSTEIVKKIKQLQAEKKDLLLTYTENDSRVKVIDKKIADLTSYLYESVKNTRKNLDTKYQRLSDDIEQAEKVFVGYPEKERMLTILNREFAIFQQSYTFLNEKKIEAEIAQAARIAFHRIISPAEAPKKPVSPNRSIITIVAAMLGLFGSVLLIFIVHAAKAKVNDPYSVENNSIIELALLTPHLSKKSEASLHFSKALNQLDLRGLVPESGILVLSSDRSGEGRGYHTLGLTHALKNQGRNFACISNGTKTPNRADWNPDAAQLNRMPQQDLKAKLAELVKEHGLLIIENFDLSEENLALKFMHLADVNLIVLDTRKTPASRVADINLLQEEYAFPNTWFILNRYAYNPNIIGQAWRLTRTWTTLLLKKGFRS